MVKKLIPLKHPPPSLLTDQEFQDIESLNGKFDWTLDWRQIEPGPLRFRITTFGHPEINVMRVDFNRGFHQIGTPPPGAITLGLTDIESGGLKSNGIDTEPGTLINFSYENSLDSINKGQFGGYVISLSESVIRSAFSNAGLDEELVKVIKQFRFWSPTEESHEQLRQTLHALRDVAISEGSEGLRKWEPVFNQDLPASIVNILAGENEQPLLSAPKFQARALKRALQIISQYDRMPASVKAFSVLVGASWSTLERAFVNEFGIPPKSCIKIRRLTAVQTELIKQGSATTVKEVAGQWGFQHMGSFAADYKKQFGELPSETLNRLNKMPG